MQLELRDNCIARRISRCTIPLLSASDSAGRNRRFPLAVERSTNCPLSSPFADPATFPKDIPGAMTRGRPFPLPLPSPLPFPPALRFLLETSSTPNAARLYFDL